MQRAIRLALVPLPIVLALAIVLALPLARGLAVDEPFPGPSSRWARAWRSG